MIIFDFCMRELEFHIVQSVEKRFQTDGRSDGRYRDEAAGTERISFLHRL